MNCFLFRRAKNFSGIFLTSSGDTESTMEVIFARFDTFTSSLLAMENIFPSLGVVLKVTKKIRNEEEGQINSQISLRSLLVEVWLLRKERKRSSHSIENTEDSQEVHSLLMLWCILPSTRARR